MLLTADFETTTNAKDCRVWAWAVNGINDVDYFNCGNNLNSMMEFCATAKENHTLYYHNLKFDGEFIINWLFENGYTHVKERKEATNKSFTTLISDMGVFYSIEIWFIKSKRTRKVTIYDSLKIINQPVRKIAKMFNMEISKLEIDYNEYRPIGHELTNDEINYIKNDVKIVAIALKFIFDQGLTKMTQGADALFDYKRTIGEDKFQKYFPIPVYDADIRQSYKGGWTYLSDKYKGKNIKDGIVLDVNSLYPDVMFNKPMPYGEGIAFIGQYEQDDLYSLYVQMFDCQFKLKKRHVPTIQIKSRSMRFNPIDYLKNSDGAPVTLCLTCVDLKLFLEQYDVYDINYISGWKFKATTGLFKDYIEKWTAVKIQATIEKNEGMRTLAKLMLNALYGKFALSPNVQSKIPYYENELVKYRLGEKETRNPIYIPVGTFITSYARDKTIRAAQSLYSRFVYADTDSLHLMGTEIPDNLEISPTTLGAWKHEDTFTRARFLRQKCYIEEIDGKLKITCAGMPESCYKDVTWSNFKIGTVYNGKLKFTRVKGGVVLQETTHTLRI